MIKVVYIKYHLWKEDNLRNEMMVYLFGIKIYTKQILEIP